MGDSDSVFNSMKALKDSLPLLLLTSLTLNSTADNLYDLVPSILSDYSFKIFLCEQLGMTWHRRTLKEFLEINVDDDSPFRTKLVYVQEAVKNVLLSQSKQIDWSTVPSIFR